MVLLLPSLIITGYAIRVKSWLLALVGAAILLPLELYLAGTPRFGWTLALPIVHCAVAPCIGKHQQAAAWILLLLVTVSMVAIMYSVMLFPSNDLK